MMAWVWFTLLTLARLNTATDPHQGRRPAAREALLPGTGPPEEAAGGVRSFHAPVWMSLEGKNLSSAQHGFQLSIV